MKISYTGATVPSVKVLPEGVSLPLGIRDVRQSLP